MPAGGVKDLGICCMTVGEGGRSAVSAAMMGGGDSRRRLPLRDVSLPSGMGNGPSRGFAGEAGLDPGMVGRRGCACAFPVSAGGVTIADRISCGTPEVSQVSKADSPDGRGEAVGAPSELCERLRRSEDSLLGSFVIIDGREIIELVFDGCSGLVLGDIKGLPLPLPLADRGLSS